LRRIARRLLIVLAAYVVTTGAWSLGRGKARPSFGSDRWLGHSSPVMLALARRKLARVDLLGSRARRADAIGLLVSLSPH
jgi:hypothetical protein